MPKTCGALFTLLILALSMAIAGCKERREPTTEVTPERSDSDGPHYVGEKGKPGVIVFVHGVLGGDPATWTNEKDKTYWPELLTKDSKGTFNDVDIYAFEYDTPRFGNALSLTEIAQQMDSIFDDDEIFDSHEEVIFLCHSMGGLLVREYLQNFQKQADKVSFIYFYSTPTQGSEVANVVSAFSENRQFGNLVPLKRDNYLANQLLRWSAADLDIPSYCAYETERTKGFQVVTMASATVLCTEPLKPIKADHIEIVKPSKETDMSYRVFRNAFNETRPVITVPVAGLDLRDAIERIVSSDPSGGGGYEARFHNCEDEVLSLMLRGDPLKAMTRLRLIELLPGSLSEPSTGLKLSVTKGGKYYEVRCSR